MKPGSEDCFCRRQVHVLRPLRFDPNLNARREVLQLDCGFGLIPVLSAWTTSTGRFPFQVTVVKLDLRFLWEPEDGDRYRRCMNPPSLLRWGDTLEPVPTCLVFEG